MVLPRQPAPTLEWKSLRTYVRPCDLLVEILAVDLDLVAKTCFRETVGGMGWWRESRIAPFCVCAQEQVDTPVPLMPLPDSGLIAAIQASVGSSGASASDRLPEPPLPPRRTVEARTRSKSNKFVTVTLTPAPGVTAKARPASRPPITREAGGSASASAAPAREDERRDAGGSASASAGSAALRGSASHRRGSASASAPNEDQRRLREANRRIADLQSQLAAERQRADAARGRMEEPSSTWTESSSWDDEAWWASWWASASSWWGDERAWKDQEPCCHGFRFL